MMNYGPTYETPQGFEELIGNYDFSFRLSPEDTERYYDNRDFQWRNPRRTIQITGIYEYPDSKPWFIFGPRSPRMGDQY